MEYTLLKPYQFVATCALIQHSACVLGFESFNLSSWLNVFVVQLCIPLLPMKLRKQAGDVHASKVEKERPPEFHQIC